MSSATPTERSGPSAGSLTLDDRGFSSLYRTAAQDLLVFFARRTYDAEAAADLMAETLAKAYLGRRGFRGSTEEEGRAWLFGIARRRFAMYVRRGKAERRALRRLGLERPQLVEGEYARIEELAGLDAMRGTLAYTTSIQVAGLARSDVSDIRILYKDEHGAEHDAAVHLAAVTGEVQERVGADRPFGVFIGFLPQAWLSYGANFDPRRCPPEEHPYDAEAIEVIAYDRQGEPITRETGNNILSVGGRPPCR